MTAPALPTTRRATFSASDLILDSYADLEFAKVGATAQRSGEYSLMVTAGDTQFRVTADYDGTTITVLLKQGSTDKAEEVMDQLGSYPIGPWR